MFASGVWYAPLYMYTEYIIIHSVYTLVDSAPNVQIQRDEGEEEKKTNENQDLREHLNVCRCICGVRLFGL